MVLSLFLIFSDFEPRCSYKIVLIKKVCIPSVYEQNNEISMRKR